MRYTDNVEVRGSTPRGTTKKVLYKSGGLAQLARAPALQAGGHGFDSHALHQRGSTVYVLPFFIFGIFIALPLFEVAF